MNASDDKNRAFVGVEAWDWRSRSARRIDLSKYQDSSYYLVVGVRSEWDVGFHFMMFYHGDDKAHVERALEFACALFESDCAYHSLTLTVFPRKPERLLRLLGYGPQDGCSLEIYERYRVTASRASADPEDSPVCRLLYAGSNLEEARWIFEEATPEYDEVSLSQEIGTEHVFHLGCLFGYCPAACIAIGARYNPSNLIPFPRTWRRILQRHPTPSRIPAEVVSLTSARVTP